LNSKREFVISLETDVNATTSKESSTDSVSKVVTILMEEDTKKLLDVVKRLNARQEFANLSQIMMQEMLPRIDLEKFTEESQSIKELLNSTELYSAKHFQRADRCLKQSYYVHFVLG